MGHVLVSLETMSTDERSGISSRILSFWGESMGLLYR